MAGCLRFLLRMVLRVDEYDWVVILMYSLLTFVCNRRSCCSAVHVSKFCSKGFFFFCKNGGVYGCRFYQVEKLRNRVVRTLGEGISVLYATYGHAYSLFELIGVLLIYILI